MADFSDLGGEPADFSDLGGEVIEQPKKGKLRQFIDYVKANPKQAASSFYRPALEVGGALGGAALAAPGTPVASAAGGALGFAGGRAAADLIDRGIGLKAPLASAGEAAKETAKDIQGGAAQEALGLVLKAIPSKVMENVLAKGAGVAGRLQSGVRAASGQRLFKNPSALFAPSTETVGAELGAAREAAGMASKPTVNEIVDTEGSTARRMARQVLNKIEQKLPVSPDELLKGKQAINKLIEKTPMMQRSQRRLLSQAGQQLSDALYAISPEERQLAGKYANSALGEEFRRFYPVTKTGDVSLTRTLFLPALRESGQALAAIPTALLAQSPFLGGLGISAAGGAYKALASALGPEPARRLLAATVQSMMNRRTANAQ